jgi:signal transduction histidine kinase/ligand-binding sensor domain-containing protein
MGDLKTLNNKRKWLPNLKWVALLMILAANQNCFSQNYNFLHYSIENGLAQSQVLKIYQDNSGYLWLGTRSGVSRFNGTDFETFSKVNGVIGNEVYSICQAKDRILFRSDGGISALYLNKIQNYPIKRGRYRNMTNDLIIDGKGMIWFINNGQLCEFEKGGSHPVSITPDAKTDFIQSISTDRNGLLYVAVYKKGIYCLSGNRWINIAPFNGAYKDLFVSKILFDNSNLDKAYLLTSKALFVLMNGVISPYRNPLLDTMKRALTSIGLDKRGDLWVGTDKGVCYLNKTDPIYFTSGNGFTNSTINDIFRDDQDNMWLATDDDGFYQFRGFTFSGFEKINGDPISAVMNIKGDEQNTLWFASFGDGLIKYSNNHLQRVVLPSDNPLTRNVTSLAYKKNNPMLIGTLGGGLWSFEHNRFLLAGKGQKLPQYINSVIYDSDNTIWISAQWGCFYLKDGKSNGIKGINSSVLNTLEIGADSILACTFNNIILIKDYAVDPNFKFNPFSNSTILCSMKYKNIILFGSFGDGLFMIDLAKRKVRKYTTLDGLNSNDVYSLTAGADGMIYAGTGRGMARFNVDTNGFEIHFRNDIVPDPILEYNQDAILNYGNKIWAGTSRGISVFNADDPYTRDINQKRPIINIESVKFIDQETGKETSFDPVPVNLLTKYSHKHISITFKGIFYQDPDNILYQYRLKGMDSLFSLPTKSGHVEYIALEPGKYSFEVKAITSSGINSITKRVLIEIKPAFYQTVFFNIIAFALVIAIVAIVQFVLQRRKNKQRQLLESVKRDEQIKVRRYTAEDFHDDIGNKLTRILMLANVLERKTKEQNEEKELIRLIKENANTLYNGAKDILWALDPQSDNLFSILIYIKNFAIDAFSNLDKTLIFADPDPKYKDLVLPLEYSRNISMIFKELLYNVLKHANAETITLTVYENAEFIVIKLVDDGAGFEQDQQSSGRGLKNIRNRARRINGTIYIASEAGKGSEITLMLDRKQLFNITSIN